MDQEKIISKIKKLFALAGDEGAAENEAATALRMANNMLEKYSISMIDLADEDKVSVTFKTESKEKWVRRVVSSVCKVYDCKHLMDFNNGNSWHLIVGTSANRMTCLIVIEQLIDQIRKQGGKADFKLGAATSLYWTCDEIYNEKMANKEEIVPGTGIISVDLMTSAATRNDSWITDNIGTLRKARKSSGNMSQAGLDYGKSLNPGARVGGKSQALLN